MQIDKYAVFGDPIEQSRSPLIHQTFAKQRNERIDYQKILGQKGNFSASLDDFFADPNAKGCNITSPFKQDALQWVTELSPAAVDAGAINTIIRLDENRFRGETTDGAGLVLDLKHQDFCISNSRILLIGAGGAARGVILPLLEQGAKQITIVNRTKAKAEDLANWFDNSNVLATDFLQMASESSQPYDLIVNCTSASLSGQLPDLSDDVLSKASMVYDMVYLSAPTAFLEHASRLGVVNTSDGLGMLVGQAAHSFNFWRGYMPDIEPVMQQIRSML
ncbi:shikimate dehydrogenase [Aliiglaciecola lipolytica]|uniref:Shikimate dehydrogenase (NADP(+)) n=1 Tax=Aliiglaciecola lipolytica E3 TaxID=1127673 RepID=K6XM16_9ALTE|nr:shikimate dehydrogenase [Aliiglaciecola lipolytica]GAC12711.1 shikimate dehydrogenase [Aliiglaciecola lipolytica E3]